eukprot:Partr_v1_DN24403_c0_g1_i5_m66638 putative EF-hand calcium binding domain 1
MASNANRNSPTKAAPQAVPPAAAALVEDIPASTSFDRRELEVLQRRFRSMSSNKSASGVPRIDRQSFRDMLSKKFGVTESLIMDRIFKVFDQDADNLISLSEFIKGMDVFLKGKFDDHVKYCFKVYDLNGDRGLSKEEMFQLLQNCLVKSDDDDDGVRDIVDIILKKLDEDRDGRVSEQDWSTAISKDNLLLEAFGQCLPERVAIEEFLETPSESSDQNALNEVLGLKKASRVKSATRIAV